MKKMSTGEDSTLGNWLKMTKTVFGKDSKAALFLEEKISQAEKGPEEEVLADEGQLVHHLRQIHFGAPVVETEIVENLSEAYYANVAAATLPLITIYNSPADFKGKYVARIHNPNPLKYAAVADSLEGIRGKLPQGLTNIGREPADALVIVETWV